MPAIADDISQSIMMPRPSNPSNATPQCLPRLVTGNSTSHADNSTSADTPPANDRIDRLRPDYVAIGGTRSPVGRHQRDQSRYGPTHDRNSHTKKKGSSVFGFLTLKEPSTSALEEYAEHERRKAAQRSAKVSTVLPGVSSQKLPDHVPRVNSKWNGLPESLKTTSKPTERSDKSRGSSNRNSIVSFTSSSHSDATRRLYGTLSSKPSIRRSQEKKQMEVQVAELHAGLRPGSRQDQYPTSPSEEANCAEPVPQLQLSGDLSAPPSMAPSEFELSLPHLLADRDYSSCTGTSPEASPRTPAAELATTDNTDSLSFSMLRDHDQFSLVDDDTAAYYGGESDEVVVRTSGPDVLHQPAIKLKQMSSQHCVVHEANATGCQVPSAPDLVRNFSHVSKYCIRTGPSSHGMTQPSSEIFPEAAVTSARKATSVRRPDMSVGPTCASAAVPIRLDPGRSSRKDEVLPWEILEPPEHIPGPSTKLEAKKLKRLSYKFGRT